MINVVISYAYGRDQKPIQTSHFFNEFRENKNREKNWK